MSEGLSFSIVINTDGRREHLKRTIASLRFLTYDNFEVCVVHGPTTDGTKELLQQHENEIKIASCPARNIAQSRNIGIALAAGDIVAFIDDDAIPEPEWLSDLAKSYRTAEVTAAGGFVYDNTGISFQTEFETTDRLGYSDSSWRNAAPQTNFPFSAVYPHLLGTNCCFRRSALLDIRGFDEEYEYFLEETDVCCRLNDAGFKIDQRADAFVHHKYAPSQIRNERKLLSNWYPLIKNRIYFGLRNARHHHSLREIVEAGLRDIKRLGSDLHRRLADGNCEQKDLERFNAQADAAVEDGILRGLQQGRKLLSAETIAAFRSPFLRYEAGLALADRRVVCFLMEDGLSRHDEGTYDEGTSQVAYALAKAGHHVHIFAAVNGSGTVDFEDDVWIHRVPVRQFPPPTTSHAPAHLWNYSRTMLREVEAVHARRPVSALYCPLWDSELIALLPATPFPVIRGLPATIECDQSSQRNDHNRLPATETTATRA